MRWTVRLALLALTICLLLLLRFIIGDFWDQYNVDAYLYGSVTTFFHRPGVPDNPSISTTNSDKIIIMAKLEAEDTDWVAEHLPESAPPLPHFHFVNTALLTRLFQSFSWQHAIYTVNPTSPTALTTPLNKGHESMAYLSYIIDNYASLPSTLAFLHSHRSGFFSAWHTDAAFHDNVNALRALRIPFVQSNGYVNLRCNWNPGCKEAHRYNKHVTPDVWRDVFAGTSTASKFSSNSTIPSRIEKREHSQGSEGQVGAACCAQFAVSRERVLQRPMSDYQQFRQWVVDTTMSDAQSGRVMEFLWHVIFGMDAV